MQRVIEFKKKSFWLSSVDHEQLNEKIAQLNREGWQVISIATNNTAGGRIHSYSLLVELKTK